MVFIETPTFADLISDLATEEEYRALQNELIVNPEAGDLVRGGGGIRKIRMATGNKGKSGSARVIYFHRMAKDQILMLLAYPKSGQENLTADQTKFLKTLVKALK
ncbi:MAG: type II toxin-antitoxin system RelE/ParE family toxin [Pseudomonadota bacterium]